MKEVIAVFDIGKTNKKILLFDKDLSVEFQEEQIFDEILDEDDFACDDIEREEVWMKDALSRLAGKYNIKAIQISTYGASLMYLGKDGNRLTPVYNYLKSMPEDVLANFYETYGGVDEFSRKTASPALGMLNSGLQILWLKKKKPEIFAQTDAILHFPQYLSYLLTGKKVTEYTSIGCHTAMWDFDQMQYHRWLQDENITLPEPLENDVTFDVSINKEEVKAGIGIHDSSASLAPYLEGSSDPFILLSTGTWCIFMNPFNDEPLTAEQLRKDTLCYMSVNQKQVKSSRLFMGHIHDVNVKQLSSHFKVGEDAYKTVKYNKELIRGACHDRLFFKDSMPEDYIDRSVDLKSFASFEAAYHQLMHDLVSLSLESIDLVVPAKDNTKTIYISGGFARNEIYVKLLAACMPDKAVYTSEIDNATALGAAITVYKAAFGQEAPAMDLGLIQV